MDTHGAPFAARARAVDFAVECAGAGSLGWNEGRQRKRVTVVAWTNQGISDAAVDEEAPLGQRRINARAVGSGHTPRLHAKCIFDEHRRGVDIFDGASALVALGVVGYLVPVAESRLPDRVVCF